MLLVSAKQAIILLDFADCSLVMGLLPNLSKRLQLDDPEERQLLGDVSWKQYETVLADLQDSPFYRISYLEGTLEIMSPGRKHEVTAESIGRLLEAYFEETRTKFWGLGSTTLRQQEKRGGTEPDKSYCIGIEKEFPDLAIEVIVTSGGINKLEVYRRLAIQEVWLFEQDCFQVWRLAGEAYERVSQSGLLPALDLILLAEHVLMPDHLEALISYRQRLRKQDS